MTREKLIDLGYENSICIDNFDEAIIGVSTDGAVIYSMQKNDRAINDKR